MVKNGLNSLRNSTSNLSLRAPPSEAESNAAARQQIADLEARIAQLQAREDAASTGEPYRPFARVSYPSADLMGLSTVYKRADGTTYQRDLAPISPEASPAPPPAPLIAAGPTPPCRQLGYDSRDVLPQRYAALQRFVQSQPLLPTPYQACPSSIPAPSPWAEQSVLADEDTPEKSLFEKYNESLREQHNKPKRSLITKGLVREGSALKSPEAYTQPFCDFLTENPTVWHAVSYFETKLEKAGFKKVGCLYFSSRYC
jgi:hypothetical protein